ncbi:helix-hairpin-helix domain-containing protein [Leucobacter sp. W1153]|uniref:helix-hairpin-helix domain-containing protein n=1 Tax=unclassified Leucobacter TaxID=2621730 RepID=UPI003F37CDF4
MAVHHLPPPEPPPGHQRWGLRLSSLEAPGPSDPPAPIDWRPPPTLRERVFRAVSVPILLGAGVFSLAVIVAIFLVFVRPSSPATEATGGLVAASAQPDGATDIPNDADSSVAAASPLSSSGPVADAEAAAAARVFVHVVGEVQAPGVVELPAGSRVEAAIKLAGGATAEAVLAGVNLARIVHDGEQIVVPNASTLASVPGDSVPSGGSAGIGSIVNINSADQSALESLPGVGPALAQRILDWRSTNGKFGSVEQLLDVAGIGAKTLEGFRDRVTV